jgi:hypothetical protein
MSTGWLELTALISALYTALRGECQQDRMPIFAKRRVTSVSQEYRCRVTMSLVRHYECPRAALLKSSTTRAALLKSSTRGLRTRWLPLNSAKCMMLVCRTTCRSLPTKRPQNQPISCLYCCCQVCIGLAFTQRHTLACNMRAMAPD